MTNRREYIESSSVDNLQEQLITLNRVTKVVKGGRNFSFSALMVVGNKNGVVGLGFGKAKEIPEAIRKATERARRSLIRINLNKHTIPHEVVERYCASKVWMMPASEGTGIIAGINIRSVLEYAGVQSILTKTYGSRNSINAAKAAFKCLSSLVDAKQMALQKGVYSTKEFFD